MNLQPVAIENIPLGKPLPWRLYDSNDRILLERGEVVEDKRQLESMVDEGLKRDMDEQFDDQATDSIAKPEDDAAKKEVVKPERVVTSEAFPPLGVKPQVWEKIQLCMYVGSTPVYYFVHLIGYIRGVSILVTTPLVNGIPIILRDGEQVEVRMMTGSNICVFTTALQRICISPYHYMHLEYPSIVYVQELRKSPRAKVSFNATATNVQGDQEIVHIVDLSPHGAQIHVPAQIGQKGDPLKLTFHAAMDGLKTTLELDTQIKHVHSAITSRNEGEGMLEYGLAFQDIPVENALWLNALVYQHIAEGDMT